jgi:tetratricopeptide (TPR) repeat protein
MRAFRFLAFFLAVSLAFSAPAAAGFIQAMAAVHFQQGQKAFNAGDFDKAIKIWTEPSVENVYRNDPGYWDWLAKAYRGAKLYDKALAMAQKGLSLQPADPNVAAELNALLALTYEDMGQYQQAIAPAQAIIAAAPKEPMAYLILGKIYLDMNRFSDAETAALRSLEIKPTGDGLAVLGVAHLHMGLIKGALQNFTMGLTYDPKNANLLRGVVAAQLSLFNLSAAMEAARNAAAAGVPDAPLYEGFVLYYQGDTAAALDKINAFIASIPKLEKDAAADFALRSFLYRAKGENDKALEDAQQAASFDKKAFASGYALGFALLGKERPQEALAAFDDPSLEPALMPFTEAHRQLGRALCYAKMGNLDKAADIYFGVAGQIDQRYAPIWQDKAALAAQFAPSLQQHLEQARKLEADGKYADCLREYAQAMRFADGKQAEDIRAASFAEAAKMPTPPELPEDARRRVVRGEALIKDGDLASAVAEFNDALRLAPYMPKLYYNAALLNGQLKKYSEAIRLMNIYLQGAPDAPDARAAKDEIIKWELEIERQGK